jgi:predicted glycosyltransferase
VSFWYVAPPGQAPASWRRALALKYLFFTNECVGLGHLRRALTIADAVTERDERATALIVTGAPIELAHPLPPRVDTIKLPLLARDSAGEVRAARLGISLPDTRAVRSQLALAAAQSFRPEVAVVDKVPLGLGGELAPALDWLHEAGAKLVLGLRDIADAPARVRREWGPRVRAQLEHLYDAVLVYGPDGNRHDALTCLGLDTELPVHHVGYVASRLADRPTDLPDEYVLVTAGGGADGARLMTTFLDALELEPLSVPGLVVTGPLMPQADVRALRARAKPLDVIVETFRPGLDGAMAGARAVVAMAGYNTVSELLRTGRPALLVPRTEPSHEQALRAELLRAEGRAQVLYPHELEPHRLRSELTRLLATPPQQPRAEDGGAGRAAQVLAELAGAIDDYGMLEAAL